MSSSAGFGGGSGGRAFLGASQAGATGSPNEPLHVTVANPVDKKHNVSGPVAVDIDSKRWWTRCHVEREVGAGSAWNRGDVSRKTVLGALLARLLS